MFNSQPFVHVEFREAKSDLITARAGIVPLLQVQPVSTSKMTAFLPCSSPSSSSLSFSSSLRSLEHKGLRPACRSWECTRAAEGLGPFQRTHDLRDGRAARFLREKAAVIVVSCVVLERFFTRAGSALVRRESDIARPKISVPCVALGYAAKDFAFTTM